MKKFIFFLALSAIVCTNSVWAEKSIELSSFSLEVEVGGTLEISCRVDDGNKGFPDFSWRTSMGTISETVVAGEVDFHAPADSGIATLSVDVSINGETVTKKLDITVLAEGALKKTADVLIVVDTNILKNVWVSETNQNENFKAPLSIKGTFRYDPETELAFAGGSWPTYPMYDDGTHGDVTADDGLWSILMKFEKTDSKVYFALDDANEYRVQYESGLAWAVKMAWIELDDFPDDHSEISFIPDSDKTVNWTAEMAEEGGIYEAR